MAESSIIAFAAGLQIFSGLPEKDLRGLLAKAHIKKFDKGEAVFLQGDKANGFYLIVEGWVKLFRDTLNGDEAVVGVFAPKESFGDAAIFEGAHYPYSAQAVEKCQVIEIPAINLRNQAVQNPQIFLHMLQVMTKNMSRVQLENEHMALMTAPQRVGCLLLQLSHDATEDVYTLKMPYDKSLAATKLGMKPETFSRALSQLNELGVSVQRNTITISSLTALASYCCNSCSAQDEDCRFSKSHASTPEQCAKCRKYQISH